MLTICRVYVRVDVEELSDADIKAIGSRAYDWVESASRNLSEVESTGVKVNVTEGSLTAVALIIASAGAVYKAITHYDDFWSGVEHIHRHAHSVASVIQQRFQKDPSLSRAIISSRVSTGALDRIHRIHEDVKTGRVDPDSAVQEVLRTFRSSEGPIDVQMLSGIEEAFGASRIGFKRLERLTSQPESDGERKLAARENEPRARRRLTIKRSPGESRPTVRFDRK